MSWCIYTTTLEPILAKISDSDERLRTAAKRRLRLNKIFFYIFDLAKRRGVICRAIKKNNRFDKNPELDRFLSRLRMPFEGVFAKLQVRARYRGVAKVQFQALAEAIAHNLKRLIVIGRPAFATG